MTLTWALHQAGRTFGPTHSTGTTTRHTRVLRTVRWWASSPSQT